MVLWYEGMAVHYVMCMLYDIIFMFGSVMLCKIDSKTLSLAWWWDSIRIAQYVETWLGGTITIHIYGWGYVGVIS